MKHLGIRQEAEFVKDEELWWIRGKEQELSSGGMGKNLFVSVQMGYALESTKPFKLCPPPQSFFLL